jgi:hypothetical protein
MFTELFVARRPRARAEIDSQRLSRRRLGLGASSLRLRAQGDRNIVKRKKKKRVYQQKMWDAAKFYRKEAKKSYKAKACVLSRDRHNPM